MTTTSYELERYRVPEKTESVAAEALSTKAEFAPLPLHDGMSRDEWESVGKSLRDATEWTQWAIGEWLNFGERKWGETYQRASEITGYSIGTLKNMASVSAKVSRRRDDLTFKHHAEVAALEPAEQERWLDKAEKNDWSTRDLREQMRLTRGGDSPAHAPLRIGRCNVCHRECPMCEMERKKGRAHSRKRGPR